MLTVKYFTASWCGPCKMFGPVFDQVMNETGVQHLKIDVDQKKDLTSGPAHLHNLRVVPYF